VTNAKITIHVNLEYVCQHCGEHVKHIVGGDVLELYDWWGGDQTGILISDQCPYCKKFNEFHRDGKPVLY
jgi:ribosomal protein L44E